MKILVVDDEADVRDLFQQKFRKEIKNQEFDFSFALSGEEALEYVHDQKPETSVILSDINMPGMSGFDLLREIKGEYKNPPPLVMMITAYGDKANYDEAMNLGADDFITKPIDFAVLKSKLNTINL